MRVRGKVGVAEVKGGREQIIISEIPYNVNRAELVKRIADLVNEKILTGISASAMNRTRRRAWSST